MTDDSVERHSYDDFWCQNQPAYHAYDLGANMEMPVSDFSTCECLLILLHSGTRGSILLLEIEDAALTITKSPRRPERRLSPLPPLPRVATSHWGRGGGDRSVPLWSEGKEIPAVEEEEDDKEDRRALLRVCYLRRAKYSAHSPEFSCEYPATSTKCIRCTRLKDKCVPVSSVPTCLVLRLLFVLLIPSFCGRFPLSSSPRSGACSGCSYVAKGAMKKEMRSRVVAAARALPAEVRVAASVALPAAEVNAAILRSQRGDASGAPPHRGTIPLLDLVFSWFCLLTVADRPGWKSRGWEGEGERAKGVGR